MTNQKIFNKVRKHLLTQKARSVRFNKQGCAYLSEDGLKCAIGCLIPNKLYNKDIEGKPVMGIRSFLYSVGILDENDVEGINNYLISNRVNLLNNLQAIHDTYEVEKWETALNELAIKFNLSF